jgi:5-methylcytosine-specific restriction endonuclease McrA
MIMRPLTKAPTPSTYAEPDPFFIIKMKLPQVNKTIQDIYEFFGTQNWLALENKANRTQGEELDLYDKQFYLNKLGAFYPEARRDLITNLDEVCSYCGMPVRDDAHVEHTLPKSYFPAQVLLWNNFLLACRDCNSKKSNTPSGAVNDSQADYAWPHSTLQAIMITYRLVSYTQYQQQQSYRKPIIDEFVKTEELIQLIHKGEVNIEMPTREVREVVISGVLKANLAVMAFTNVLEARRTVEYMLELNRYTYTKDVSDRRLIERTQAWIQAVDAVRNLCVVQGKADAVRSNKLRIPSRRPGSGLYGP